MTSAETNVLMIALILVALCLVGYIARQYLWRWRLWLVPVTALLLLGLLYSVVYILDAGDGSISNPTTFNFYNQILRGGSYVVIIAYLIAFIAVQKIVVGDKHG